MIMRGGGEPVMRRWLNHLRFVTRLSKPGDAEKARQY
jgi:hypothetical protein